MSWKGVCNLDNKLHQRMVKKAVQGKFRGTTQKVARVTPKYPDSAEREFKRVTNTYMRELNRALKEVLPDIMADYKETRRGRNDSARYDDFRDLERRTREKMRKVSADLEQRTAKFNLARRVKNVSKMTKNNAVREWKRTARKTLGIDLMDDYYSGEFYGNALKSWVDGNVVRITSLPQKTLGNMTEIILQGYRSGKTIRDITEEIQDEYNVSKKWAQFVARDQVSTLNSQITRRQQEDAGCTKYRWSTSKDSRVRDCHAELDGKIFSWDDPPEMWYETKSGIVYTGRFCNPGEDYSCRCCAIPVFDVDKLDVPMKGELTEEEI